MQKRAIKATSIMADIRAGMDDTGLMDKHRMSPKSLDKVFRKLLKAGTISRAELAARQSDIDDIIEVTDGDSDSESTTTKNVCEVNPRASRFMFSGRVECVDILDYIQFVLMDGRRAVLEVKSMNGSQCRLYIDGGQVLHAQSADLEGEEAFFQCTQYQGGEFSHLPWTDPERISIEERGTFILLEAARKRDEAFS
jgi:hypothetical protein